MAGRGPRHRLATRAQIIENLIGEQYMHREGREPDPHRQGSSLMTLLNGLGVNELTQPELTGEWEWQLGRIEKGEFTREEFMREIAEMTRHIVERAKTLRQRHHPRRLRPAPVAPARAAAASSAKPTRNPSAATATMPCGRRRSAASSSRKKSQTLLYPKADRAAGTGFAGRWPPFAAWHGKWNGPAGTGMDWPGPAPSEWRGMPKPVGLLRPWKLLPHPRGQRLRPTAAPTSRPASRGLHCRDSRGPFRPRNLVWFEALRAGFSSGARPDSRPPICSPERERRSGLLRTEEF